MVMANVCFYHNNTATKDSEDLLAQYQLIMVNEKGSWKHAYGAAQQRADGSLCFSEVMLNTEEFTVTGRVTVIVTKTAVNDVTVLASGRSDIFFTR